MRYPQNTLGGYIEKHGWPLRENCSFFCDTPRGIKAPNDTKNAKNEGWMGR